MKKLFGFTLAEVLVTLGIIGVVAALTTPTLVSNVKNKSYAAVLKSTIGDLENAFASAMAQEGVESIFETSISKGNLINGNSSDEEKNEFFSNLEKYLKISNGSMLNSFLYYSNKGTNVYNMNANGGKGAQTSIANAHIPIELKNGSTIFIKFLTPSDFHPNNAGSLYIDVNGISSPNVIGRDVFRFMIRTDGTLVPIGSQKYKDEAVAGDASSLWTEACPKNGAIQSGQYCTARLIENGYEFDY